MARPRQRVRLEDGLKLDLNKLVRERLSGGSAEVVHCHMLFHLAHPFMQGTRRVQVERAIERLIDRHGEGNYLDCTLKLTFPRNPNGVYFLKGGGPDVWRKFRVPRCWRKPLGLIHGKRCGVTENVGATARSKFKEQRGGIQREAAVPYFVSLPCAYKTRQEVDVTENIVTAARRRWRTTRRR